jgi:hypothetical protein
VKLVHLVGFIVKKFVTMPGRSHERKMPHKVTLNSVRARIFTAISLCMLWIAVI